MSEELRSASNIVPRAILAGLTINGSLGFATILAILFCSVKIDEALNSSTGYPFMEIFLQGTKSVGGTAAMASFFTVMMTPARVPILAATSREFWSLARDRGYPGWRTFRKVAPRAYSSSIP